MGLGEVAILGGQNEKVVFVLRLLVVDGYPHDGGCHLLSQSLPRIPGILL